MLNVAGTDTVFRDNVFQVGLINENSEIESDFLNVVRINGEKSADNEENVENNNLFIHGGNFKIKKGIGAVYSENINSSIKENTVTIDSSLSNLKITDSVIGVLFLDNKINNTDRGLFEDNSLLISDNVDNNINISNSSIYGVKSMSTVKENVANIENTLVDIKLNNNKSNINADIYGVYSNHNGNILNTTLNLISKTLDGSIYGVKTEKADISVVETNVNVKDVNVNGSVYGIYSADDTGGAENGEKISSVYLTADNLVVKGDVYGVYGSIKGDISEVETNLNGGKYYGNIGGTVIKDSSNKTATIDGSILNILGKANNFIFEAKEKIYIMLKLKVAIKRLLITN